MTIGQEVWGWANELFPICRSITGEGTRKTLSFLNDRLDGIMTIHGVSSGTKAFDWIVPDEWTIHSAYLEDESGNRIIDFNNNNLHIVGYSEPVDAWLTLEELDPHLHSLPAQPKAIPYVTSYYAKRWGFCLSHDQKQTLKPGRYHAVIDSEKKQGVLNYGEIILPGKTKDEIFLSTYICHPSMANNELSGPVVTAALVRWLRDKKDRYYTYRIVFIPETIGSIVYLSKNLKLLKRQVVAGFVVTCVGDERCYSYLPSRAGDTLADRAALHVLKYIDPKFKRYTWLDRGSDERQYCAPGVDLPIATLMRSKYVQYPEYHTSLDDLRFVTPAGLQGGFEALRQVIEVLESNVTPRVTVLCEPQLGKRDLYPTLSTKESGEQVRVMMNLISYCDGKHSLLDIAEIIGQPLSKLNGFLKKLIDNKLIEVTRTYYRSTKVPNALRTCKLEWLPGTGSNRRPGD